METIGLYDYLKELNVDAEARNKLGALILFGPEHPHNYSVTRKGVEGKTVPADFKISDDILGLMEEVNLMVKHRTCPNNFKNRFYKYKLKVLEACLADGRVSSMYDEGKYFSLTVDGRYKFHQLKDDHPTWSKRMNVKCIRKYVPSGKAIPFNIDTFTRFQMSAILFLARRKNNIKA